MNKTTYHANKNLVLVDNEVYVLGKMASVNHGDLVYDTVDKNIVRLLSTCGSYCMPVTATTNKNIPNIHHLERKLFVKPDVDVEDLASFAVEGYTEDDYGTSEHDFKVGFICGFNANKKEFTREEVENIMELMWKGIRAKYASFNEAKKDILNTIRPLSLLSSIEANEDFTDIKINW